MTSLEGCDSELSAGLQGGMEVSCWLMDAPWGSLLICGYFWAGVLQRAAGRVGWKPCSLQAC